MNTHRKDLLRELDEVSMLIEDNKRERDRLYRSVQSMTVDAWTTEQTMKKLGVLTRRIGNLEIKARSLQQALKNL